jgi:hypothetical protein
MKIAISQPTYLPWIGYFDLMDQVETFVLLDDVQFEKRSWQQRNRIKTPAGLQWLTVPAAVSGRAGQLIKEVEIKDVEFWRDHCRSIELNYRRSKFFDDYFAGFIARLTAPSGIPLADLNIRLIEWFMEMLGITTPLVMSSSLRETGARTQLLANICEALGATQYLSPLGSAVYLMEGQNMLLDQGIELMFQNYEHPVYGQLFPPFVPFASTVDLLFNEGERSLEIIRGGRRQPFLPCEVAAQVGTNAPR